MNVHLPPYKIFPLLTGNSIHLRPIEASDVADLVPISFYDGQKASSTEEAADMLKKINRDYADGNSIHWGIAGNDNKIVGTCGYYRGFENDAGELGCILLPEFTGKGYMSEALRLAIDFGMDQMQLKRVFAITANQNVKALRLLERLGFARSAELEGDSVEFILENNHLHIPH